MRGYKITYKHTSPDALHGRFGGGWQWNVGVQAGAGFRTIIVNLLVASVRIQRPRRTP